MTTTKPARYRYRSRLYHALGAQHGELCDPVRRADGRCVVGPRAQLVRFVADGEVCVVIRRALRLADKGAE